jgi:hypothetical protein
MPTFPILKTGAVAQYPATRSARYQNQAVRFVDGTEQRYRDSAGPLHRWVISLTLLDECERANLAEFFRAVEGAFGDFAFTDPWDDTEYPSCCLASDEMDIDSTGEMRGATSLTIVENRT